MRVFKFGGAALQSADAVKNAGRIIQQERKGSGLVVVVSAMAKTTNALEKLLSRRQLGQKYTEEWLVLKQFHLELAQGLFPNPNHPLFNLLASTFDELEVTLTAADFSRYDFAYDQVVSFGELLSSRIVAAWLEEEGLFPLLLDARHLIRTDDTWREGRVDRHATNAAVTRHLKPALPTRLVLTQGFLGGTIDGHTTTLGREGSDYTAALLAASLEADSLTIWKDVPGVLNADPRKTAHAVLLPYLTYEQAAQMTFYGATVIHPKTIAPLALAAIPLFVRSFLNPGAPGTIIGRQETAREVSAAMEKSHLVLLSFWRQELAFVDAPTVALVMEMLQTLSLPVYLLHHEALQLAVVTDELPQLLMNLTENLPAGLKMSQQSGLTLQTVLNPADNLELPPKSPVLFQIKSHQMMQILSVMTTV